MNFTTAGSKHKLNRSALNLSSMIDVTFLLLIYFIVTTVFTPPEEILSPALQIEEGNSIQATDFEPQIILVDVKNDKAFYQIGENIIYDRSSLSRLIQKLPKDPGIIIRVDDDVPVGFAIAAVQISRDAGFQRVTYVPAIQ
tara:strand:- start:352 stop:774 length:423 start_codon:yes stop_codon:yes gene_type:complete